jgi:hypothetical protein
MCRILPKVKIPKENIEEFIVDVIEFKGNYGGSEE